MKAHYILTEDELHVIAKDIVNEFGSGVVILRGDLAAGKTTLVRAIAKEMGVADEVTSPTFSLQQVYGRGLFHYDIYNHGLEHFISLGMLEELEKEGLHCVEWGDATLQNTLILAGFDVMSIEIEKIADNKREYSVCTH